MNNLNKDNKSTNEEVEVKGLDGFDSMGDSFCMDGADDDTSFCNELDIDVDTDDEIQIDLDDLE